MAKKFGEYLQIQLPSGAKEQLAKVARRKYDTVGGEKLEKEGVCLVPTETKAA
jgi:hypothetical protein